ncbi:MAG: hypothetical protein EOP47_04880 [Sphingobacteriaceae bacterium]|nr:MAG: hypothetical protein EOP47_04880 [Sphingobacteriaceae bacterium]
MKTLRKILLFSLSCWCVSTQAQRVTDPLLKSIVKTTVGVYEKKPFEKLYVQTDKPGYLEGDTIRLKAYLFNGHYQSPSALSGILYVELDDEAGKNVKRMMLPVSIGMAWADMALDTADVKQGNYTLRAYTNWMRNFGEDYIFKKKIPVSGHQDNPILVSSLFKQTGAQVETALQFRTLDGRLMSFKDVELTLMIGKKNVSKDKFTIGPDGKVKFNFAMPEGNEPLSIKAMIAGNAELTIPVTVSRTQNMDVQFMPEGGALVAGIKSKVGFKAIGEDGKGVNISGKIINSKGEDIAVINTLYKGMGSFEFIPAAGETYTAKLNGNEKTYPLLGVKPLGTVVSVIAAHNDSLKINISYAPGITGSYYLIGQARGVVCYAEPVNLSNGTVTKSVAKNLFPTGITRFTLLNAAQQPVNERIVFINHKDELKFNIQPSKNNYATRDMVSLSLLVTDKDGKPVEGSFSMAVTDKSQVNIDKLGNNILTHLLLTSDLKGEIEQPGYYFTGNKDAELDNLLLTQGWVGYDWKELLSTETKPIAYQQEKEYTISGKVTNAFGKGVELSPISLLSNKPYVAMDTLSGKDGRFSFTNVWPVDTAIFKLQARNKNNKAFNVVITMDEQTFPEFKPDLLTGAPWYVNADTTLLNNATSVAAEEKAKKEYKGEGTELKEVNIKAKKVVKRSSNLNGPGEADLVFDERDMLKAGRKTLENLLAEKIKGFGTGPFTPSKRRYDELVGMEATGKILAKDFPLLSAKQLSEVDKLISRRTHKPWRYGFLIKDQEVRFIIDGVNLDLFYDDRDEVVVANGITTVAVNNNDTKRYQYIKTHLLHFTAEDILGIEVLSSGRYTNKYNSKFEPIFDRVGPGTVNEAVYIEITTRTKQGPFLEPTIGTYLHKPLAFTLPKQFYSPKYTVANKNTDVGTDMRSTIFWDPNIITDSLGRATVSFYSSDNAADYSVIVEGTDMSGGLGFGEKELKLTSTQGQRITDPVLKNMVKTAVGAYGKKPVEKLYVQTDKPVYLHGDTLRLKAYLLNGDYQGPSALSGILYVELDNEAGNNIKRLMLPVSDGLAWADIALDTANFAQGNYTLRAYTNWMRNFGEDYIFTKKITVSGYQDNPILVSSLFQQNDKQVETALQFKTLDGRLISFKDVELKLMRGKKNISKDKFTIGPDGKVKLNFTMPEGSEPLSIKAMIAGNVELTIPVTLPRPQNMDVQFMPEGGALVAGIKSKVGFKAIGEDGRGINVSGNVLNSKGEQVALINTLYKGMGSFTFIPQTGENYTAKLNGKSYSLPLVKPAGTVLTVTSLNTDLLNININATTDHVGNYYLIGQARGVVYYAEPVSLSNGAVNKSIAKTLFPTGIVRFTLLNSAQQPVNERIVFINHKDELRFNIQPHKSSYATRDSIALSVSVTDKDGKPVKGNFSMAVTDKSQVSLDSLGSNILNNLLLTSDLMGEIENPNYYFIGNKEAELDNLMLTQGWVGYDWKEILSPETKPIAYQPEKEYVISGKVTNAFGKPIEKSPIALLSNKPFVAMDALTDKDGRFSFKDVWPVDTAIFKLQARNVNNKEFNVTIKMDEQIFPEFKPNSFIPSPWYLNTDTALLNNAKSQAAEAKAKKEYKGEGMALKQVEIKAKKVVKGSKNLNGPGEADLVLDEKDMLKAGKRTLTDLLREKIPGITEYGYLKKSPQAYFVYGKLITLFFDGLSIDKFYSPPDKRPGEHGDSYLYRVASARHAYIKQYLDYYSAEDVVGIEYIFNNKYAMAYVPAEKFNEIAIIEITTRSKKGPFMKVTPGTFLYKPLAFTLPKQFYSPKYTVTNKNTAIGTDMRSTIFWEPNINTDASGKATVSFYSADKSADYSVIVEGTDMNGGLGFGKKTIPLSR